jgi:ribosomal protein S18 acetylase RimI-like enzyme
MPYSVRPLTSDDEAWVLHCLERRWGSPCVVSRGVVHQAHRLPGFVAEQADERVGLVTYHIEDSACEIVTLDSFVKGRGVGSELLKTVKNHARQMRCTRLWLITTNDNISALHFYQKRGFFLAAIHLDAVIESRKLKPEIPLLGYDGIPVRDEIELRMFITQGSSRAV